MDLWTRIIGVALALYAGFVINRGQIKITNDQTLSSTMVKRSEKPVQFWLTVGLMLVMAVVMIFNVFHF